MLSVIIGAACLAWYLAVLLVCAVGYIQIFRHYRHRSRPAISESLPSNDVPHITVIRPIKGLEPDLYQCLAASFHQTYPLEKLTIYFCISSRNDPSLPILEQLLEDFPRFDAKILVEDEDAELQSGKLADFGPNPKIRNMSRAYREAKGDIVWIIDCNVWFGRGVAGRMVDTLCGLGGGQPYKFVHQLPLVVDITNTHTTSSRSRLASGTTTPAMERALPPSSSNYETLSTQKMQDQTTTEQTLSTFGGRLDELFLSSAHAKFYTAINTVAIAPCIVGKSNMFRRSHLNALTSGRGIDFFSHNICEDHLIGDLLWKQPQPFEVATTQFQERTSRFGKHAMLFGDLAIQPTAHMSVSEYTARRIRWLRVRKFTVTLATLVEPGTESFLCSAYGALAATTLPCFENILGIPRTWGAFGLIWMISVSMWMLIDWTLYGILQGMRSVETDENTPSWARGPRTRSFWSWLAAWLGRETLTLPIWIWAVWGGVSVVWRGRKFRVGLDMRVKALDEPHETPLLGASRSGTPRNIGHANGKARRE